MNQSRLPIYQQKGGGQIGYCWPLLWEGTRPFARLQIYTDRVILSIWPFKSSIKIKDIDSITKTFWHRIRINHHGPNAPYLVFFPSNIDEVVDTFRKIGVKIKD